MGILRIRAIEISWMTATQQSCRGQTTKEDSMKGAERIVPLMCLVLPTDSQQCQYINYA
jgi:hypothetical protein